MSTDVNIKINKPLSPYRPPTLPPPPIPPNTLSSTASHPLKNKIHTQPIPYSHTRSLPMQTANSCTIHILPKPPINITTHTMTNPKTHTQIHIASVTPSSKSSPQKLGTLLLGVLDTKHTSESNQSPQLHPHTQQTHIYKPILTHTQRNILSKILLTILSNTKTKQIPNDVLTRSRRPSLENIYSSDISDPHMSDLSEKETLPKDSDSIEGQLQSHTQIAPSPEPAFIDKALSNITPSPTKEKEADTESKKSDKLQKQKAKVIHSDKEKVILMASIIKYINDSDMDTIHKACFHLWKDWYICYGTINRQFQTAFKCVCEKLLTNVDSKALDKKSPNEEGECIEQITYELSVQISTLKHAFATEQLHTPQKNGTTDSKQNVSQIIDSMEPNVWSVVRHIIFEYFSSVYWVQCKHALFNLFLTQYENMNRKLDRECITHSCFGVYTLIVQLCEAIKCDKSDSIDDGFNLDKSSVIPVPSTTEMAVLPNTDSNGNECKDSDTHSNSSNNDCVEFKNVEYTNDELLHTLNWYYSVCRLQNVLNNRMTDYLTYPLYTLYKPICDPLFTYFAKRDAQSNTILQLIQSICDESDYLSLKQKYTELQTNKDNKSPKKKQPNFVSLLSRITDSCITWICRDLYPNYRTSEFCVLLTQLLADPHSFKSKKENQSSFRIRRLHKRFNLPSDQQYLNSFSCALDSGRFLHHGKIYFFKDYLCFFSIMLGIKDTQQKFLLPVIEIKAITKKITAWVFHNAIEIQMKDGRNFIFRTFLKRDLTFDLLQKLINNEIDWDEVAEQQSKELEEELKEEEKMELKVKERQMRSQSTGAMKNGKSKGNTLMTEISGFGMSTWKNALSAIDVSSSKLLSTDAKLLLQSGRNKDRKSTPKKENVPTPVNGKNLTVLNESNASNAMELKNMRKKDEIIYNTNRNGKTLHIKSLKPLTNTTRSAPTSPTFSKSSKEKESIKASSDSETVGAIELPLNYDSDSSHNYVTETPKISAIHCEDEMSILDITQVQREESKELIQEITDEIKEQILDTNGEQAPIESEQELTAKCAAMNTIDSQWIYHQKPKVEKDFEVIVEYEFKDIGIEEFWDKFWSNNAIYSPIDWIRDDPLNSNIESNEWKCDGSVNECDEQWYMRNLSCVTKLEKLPKFLGTISQCASAQIFRHCLIQPYFYVVHKVLSVNDIPYADCYNTHQKFEFVQSANVVDKTMQLSTHLRIYIGFEWLKNTWFKSLIRSRTEESIKADCIKYCECINKKVQLLREEKDSVSLRSVESKPMIKSKKKRKKAKITRVKPKKIIPKMEEKALSVSESSENDYDFVFKIGNENSLIRCRLLLSCFTRSRLANAGGNGLNTSVIAVMVVLAMFVALFGLYALSSVITLISSVLQVLTSSAEYIHQMSQMNQYRFGNNNNMYFGNSHLKKESFECGNDTNNECMHMNKEYLLLQKHCNELDNLIHLNPENDVLYRTFYTLDCAKIQK